MKSLWFAIKWGTLIVVTLLAIVSIYLYMNIDSQLKIFVQKKLSQQLSGFVTVIESAQFVPSKGVVVRGIEISLPGRFEKPEQIIVIQEAFIVCDVELQSILSGNTKPLAIRLQKLTLHLTQDENGKIFGWEQLQSLKPSGESCPIEICDSEVIYRDLRKPDIEPLWLKGLNFRLTPPDWDVLCWDISGSMENQKLGTIECQAKFSQQTHNLTLSGNAKKINLGQELISYLPKLHIPTIFQKSLESFQAKLDFHFEAEYDALKNEHLPFATTFHIQGTLDDGKMVFPLVVERSIADIQFGFDITHNSLRVTDFAAISGETNLQLAWEQMGLTSVHQGKLGFHVKNYRFDNHFLPAIAPWLPQRLNDQLENFLVEGQADLTGIVHYNGRQWGIESTDIQLANLALTYEKFPYKLDYLQGTISIAPQEMQTHDGQRFFEEALSIKLASPDGKTSIQGGLYQILSGHCFGKVVVTADQVAINEKLMQAIPPSQRSVLQSLEANGYFSAKLEITLPDSGNRDGEILPDLLLQVVPDNCSVCYDQFRLPLRNVRGNLEMRNGNWTFRNLYAENGTSMINGKGHLQPTASGGFEFRLDLATDNTDKLGKSNWLKLNEDLFEAFEKESHKKLLKGLNLSGRAHVELTIQYLSDTQEFHIAFDAMTDPDVTKIKPEAFQLPLEEVACNIRFMDGTVRVDGFRGRKSDAFLSANMFCLFREDGGLVMNIDNLLAERFEHDTELIRAMPPDLQYFVSKLDVKEPVTLRGSLCFQKDAETDSPFRSYWNIAVICHQNSAMLGVPLTNICGKVNLLGKNDENGNTVFGKLELDSVNYGDYQLTNVGGPFSFHDNTIILGRQSLLPGFAGQPNVYRQTGLNASAEFAPMIPQPAMIQPAISQPQTQSFASIRLEPDWNDPTWLLSLTIAPHQVEDRSIIASVYDGELWFDGRVFLTPSMNYRLQTKFHEINLERVTRETLAEHSFKGKLSGDIQLQGGNSRETMQGNGILQLREADIYKLPTMQKIMQFFRVRNHKDEQSAICSGDIAFSWHGNRGDITDVRLEGNVLSLSGTGKITDLENPTISLILGTQLTAIAVEGPLGNLSVRPIALPNIRQALQTQQDSRQNNRPVLDFIRNAGTNVSKLNPIR